MIPLTPRQIDCFIFVRTFIEREGASPTYREIGEALGVTPAAAYWRVRGLVERGWVTRTNQDRSIELVDNSLPSHDEWERITAAASDKVGSDERSARVVMRAIGGR